MKLVKTTLLSGISTLSRLASGFISIKVIAVIIGPAGVALVGQFANFITMVTTIASGAINNGIVSYTAKNTNNTKQLYKVWQTGFCLSAVLSFICTVVLLLFRNQISIYFLHSDKYTTVIVYFAISILLFVWNQLLLSILNGLGKIAKLTTLSILSNIIGLIISILLVIHWQITGALIALAIIPNLMFLVSIVAACHEPWFKLKHIVGKIDLKVLKELKSYTFMAIVAAIVTPLQQLAVRNLIISKIGIDVAGCWQGIQKISDAYLAIVYTAFSTYFLPKFASLSNNKLIKQELKDCYKLIIPFLLSSIIIIYISREYIVRILFSNQFDTMNQLFFWQLVGDFFKTVAWPLGLIFVAKGNAMIIGINDVIFNGLIVILSYGLINYIPLQSTVLAFAITYFLWFIQLILLYRYNFPEDRSLK